MFSPNSAESFISVRWKEHFQCLKDCFIEATSDETSKSGTCNIRETNKDGSISNKPTLARKYLEGFLHTNVIMYPQGAHRIELLSKAYKVRVRECIPQGAAPASASAAKVNYIPHICHQWLQAFQEMTRRPNPTSDNKNTESGTLLGQSEIQTCWRWEAIVQVQSQESKNLNFSPTTIPYMDIRQNYKSEFS